MINFGHRHILTIYFCTHIHNLSNYVLCLGALRPAQSFYITYFFKWDQIHRVSYLPVRRSVFACHVLDEPRRFSTVV